MRLFDFCPVFDHLSLYDPCRDRVRSPRSLGQILKTIIFDALKVQRSSDAKYTPSRFPPCFEQASIVCDCMRHAALRPASKAMFSCYRNGAAIDTQRRFAIGFYAGSIERRVDIEGVIAIQVQRCVSYCHGPNSIPNHAAASLLQAKVKGIAAEG